MEKNLKEAVDSTESLEYEKIVKDFDDGNFEVVAKYFWNEFVYFVEIEDEVLKEEGIKRVVEVLDKLQSDCDIILDYLYDDQWKYNIIERVAFIQFEKHYDMEIVGVF